MIVAGILFVFVPVTQADILSTGIIVAIRGGYRDMKKSGHIAISAFVFYKWSSWMRNLRSGYFVLT